MIKRLIVLATALTFGAGLLSLPACNTVEGAGKDVKSGGQAVENTARDAKDNR